MTHKTSNPAAFGARAGLGNVVSWQPIDTREDSQSLSTFQGNLAVPRQNAPADRAPFDAVAWIARRYRMTPVWARLVAELSGIHAPDYQAATPKKGAAA